MGHNALGAPIDRVEIRPRYSADTELNLEPTKGRES